MDIIERLKLWNPWWEGQGGLLPPHYIRRNIEEELLKFANDRIAKMVVGPRRAGKTTLIYSLATQLTKKKGVLYINLEDIYLREHTLEELIAAYIRWSKDDDPIIFIDEVQRAEEWGSQLRVLLDREGFSIYTSGSTAHLLRGKVGSLLGGRAIEFQLYPLSIQEVIKGAKTPFRARQKLEGFIDDALEFGLFPAIVEEKDKEKKLSLLSSYVDTVVSRDVSNEINESYTTVMEAFRYLVDTVGNPASVNAMRKALNISFEKAEKIYEGFLNAYTFIDVPFFTHSIKVRRHMPRKIYPIDVGYITLIRPNRDKGKKLEALAALELLKAGYELNYYRGKRECDMIAVKDGKAIPIQVTWDNVSVREKEGLVEAEKETKTEGMLVTRETFAEFLKVLWAAPRGERKRFK